MMFTNVYVGKSVMRLMKTVVRKDISRSRLWSRETQARQRVTGMTGHCRAMSQCWQVSLQTTS